MHWLRISGVIEELYDVAVLPGIQRPWLLVYKAMKFAGCLAWRRVPENRRAGWRPEQEENCHETSD